MAKLKIMCEMMKKCVFFSRISSVVIVVVASLALIVSAPSTWLSTQTLFSILLFLLQFSFMCVVGRCWCCCFFLLVFWFLQVGEMTKTAASSQYQYPCIWFAKNMNNMYCKLNYLYIECCLF